MITVTVLQDDGSQKVHTQPASDSVELYLEGSPIAIVRFDHKLGIILSFLSSTTNSEIVKMLNSLFLSDFDKSIGFPPKRCQANAGTLESFYYSILYLTIHLGFRYRAV